MEERKSRKEEEEVVVVVHGDLGRVRRGRRYLNILYPCTKLPKNIKFKKQSHKLFSLTANDKPLRGTEVRSCP